MSLYLLMHHNLKFCVDPTYPKQFSVCYWREFYDEFEEPIPPIAPKAVGKGVDLCLFIDYDDARNICTCICCYTLILQCPVGI